MNDDNTIAAVLLGVLTTLLILNYGKIVLMLLMAFLFIISIVTVIDHFTEKRKHKRDTERIYKKWEELEKQYKE